MDAWVRRFMAENQSLEWGGVFYTWWADACTVGIGLAKRRFPGLVAVSRAHSADLYTAGLVPPYQPCRGTMYSQLDRLYPDSERGAAYVRDQFRWFAERCIPARQGVMDPGFQTAPSADEVFRIVSCSFVIPRKRVGLLARGLILASLRRPSRQFEWTHIGDGPQRTEVEQALAEASRPNLASRFPGMLSPKEMFEFYRTHAIDLFVNVSEQEGTPVSLMEAASCGMPMLATAVGGNVEVVSKDVGNLLAEDADENAVADAVLALMDDPAGLLRRRQAARRCWEAKYDAAANYQRFADELIALRDAH
jgi:glycosyltransferase involved in cell wall biosynthesis